MSRILRFFQSGLSYIIVGTIALGLTIWDLQNQEEEQLVSANTGVLKPISNILFSEKDKIYTTLQIGDGVTIFGGPNGESFFKNIPSPLEH
jgi:hypothetical protein